MTASLATFGWLSLLAALAWTVRDATASRPSRLLGWAWWLLLAVVAFRWPILWFPHQQNPDESQLIAGSITLRQDPVFWRSVDGGTAGPIDFYPLLPAAWNDGTTAHAVARGIGLAAVLAKALLTSEPLSLWGWRSSLSVDASRPQAARQAHSENKIYPGPLQTHYLRRYLGDSQASNPPVFVDAVGLGNFAFGDRDGAHEAFSPLRAWISANNTPVADLGGSRLHAPNDRLAEATGLWPWSRSRF